MWRTTLEYSGNINIYHILVYLQEMPLYPTLEDLLVDQYQHQVTMFLIPFLKYFKIHNCEHLYIMITSIKVQPSVGYNELSIYEHYEMKRKDLTSLISLDYFRNFFVLITKKFLTNMVTILKISSFKIFLIKNEN